MARKRAPGGGRKPIGPSAARAQFSVRMPDDLRAELEASAAKRGRTLTQELLWRLRLSLNRERIDRQDQVTRAICFLISDLAEKLHFRQGDNWHRDPFTFRAFKLAVAKLLDALEPSGEAVSPFAKLEGSEVPLLRRQAECWFKTPESAATHVATITLQNLFQPRKITVEEKAVLKQADVTMTNPDLARVGDMLIDEFEREYFAMDIAGRVLGISQSHGSGVFRHEGHKKGD
jgi:Arc-like DNA binding domain